MLPQSMERKGDGTRRVLAPLDCNAEAVRPATTGPMMLRLRARASGHDLRRQHDRVEADFGVVLSPGGARGGREPGRFERGIRFGELAMDESELRLGQLAEPEQSATAGDGVD